MTPRYWHNTEIIFVHYCTVNQTINHPHAIVTYPHFQASEIINAEIGAQHLYRCRSSSAILKPKSGDCCILCSFGNRDCSSSEQNLAA